MTGLPERDEEILRGLAQAVCRHRRAGGTLDSLPPDQKAVLRALDGPRRAFFMAALSAAEAEAGRERFRGRLRRWQARQGEPDPDGAP
jgi:hypothetical protein